MKQYDVIFIGSGHSCWLGALLLKMAGSYIDVLTLIINQKIGARELSGMIFSFPTPTYALISSLLPLFLKRG